MSERKNNKTPSVENPRAAGSPKRVSISGLKRSPQISVVLTPELKAYAEGQGGSTFVRELIQEHQKNYSAALK